MGQTPTKQANAHKEHGQRSETHSVDVSTDSNGDGSATVTWDEGFGGNVRVFPALPEQGDVWVSSKGDSQATVNVGGATASSTVTVEVVAFGDD
jgi:hypothetical protein